MKTDWPGVKTDSYLMFFNPWTQHLLGVINPMPTMRLKKINNSSQQAGACHANSGGAHLIKKYCVNWHSTHQPERWVQVYEDRNDRAND